MRTRTVRGSVRLCAAAALLAACSNVAGPGGEFLGYIWQMPGEPPMVVVPQTAQRGEPFTVTVGTQGGGCVSEGPTRVRLRGMSAEVRPYDVDSGHEVCTADIRMLVHTATLRFDQPGTATVEFHGHGRDSPEELVITRTVTIQ